MYNDINDFLSKMFDPAWYLQTYQDVKHAGVDPWEHYVEFGRNEGRFPCRFDSLDLEQTLWSTEQTLLAQQQLCSLAESANGIEKTLACWVLARWYGSYGKWSKTIEFLPSTINDPIAMAIINHQGPFLLLFDAYIRLGNDDQAKALLSHELWEETNDKYLARNMLVEDHGRIENLSQLYHTSGLTGIAPKDKASGASIDNLVGISVPSSSSFWGTLFQPLVSIVVPCFNAEDTISTAISSLLNQSWKNLEVIVVDDASTDNSWQVLQKLAEQDARLKLIRHQENLGAYRARNLGLQSSKGRYITVHDSDDWSHPQKIEKQLYAIKLSRKAVASVSHLVRCDDNLHFQRWRMEEGWIFRNVSSLMFKRTVFKRLGFWDNVSVSADTEFFYRILKVFGGQAIVEAQKGIPLSLCRVSNESLSQTKASHLRTQFKGLRKDYMDAASAWHQSGEKLCLPRLPERRPFEVPCQMVRGTEQQRLDNLYLRITSRNLFDNTWYLDRYPDVRAANVDPLRHFLLNGMNEGRDFSASFSVSGKAYVDGVGVVEAIEWLVESDLVIETISCQGDVQFEQRPTIICVGHQVSLQTYGAERSFLDSLEMLSTGDWNVVVILPNASNPEYVSEVRHFCCEVVFQPLSWWSGKRAPDQKSIDSLRGIIAHFNPKAMYVNTLVIAEPLIAASQSKIVSFMHIRELPAADPDLCQLLESSPEEIRNHCLSVSDYVITNSKAVFDYVNSDENTHVIPNIIDQKYFDAKNNSKAEDNLVGSMLSSNIPQKGVADFVQIVAMCAELNLPSIFRVYGPENEYTEKLKRRYKVSNIEWMGYCDSPELALANSDIILNLSHFQESFGRTVLEAMASRCAVVAYDWGAIPELLDDSCGILVPFKNIEGVVDVLEDLAKSPEKIAQLGSKGFEKARSGYDKKNVGPRLIEVIDSGIKKGKTELPVD